MPRLSRIAQASLLALTTLTLMSTALAQSNTTATLVVRAAPQAQVLIENLATGQKRRAAVDAEGRLLSSALPPGRYRITLLRGEAVERSTELELLVGQSGQADLRALQLDQVVVAGTRKVIDVTNTDNGATFTAKQLDNLPMGRDLNAIIQLAPNTAPADPRYRGASFGGGAASENAYYINGFPVVSAWKQLGSSELPFGAIEQAQVLTGGFGAEFGRSIGGVVNIVTKSGSNDWVAGGRVAWSPNALRAAQRDILYPMTGKPEGATTDGTMYRHFSDREVDRKTAGVYAGGPLIPNKLFMFVAAEQERTTLGETRISTAGTAQDRWGWRDADDATTRYVGKFDWNLTDDHRLELTLIGDTSTRKEELRGYDYATGAKGGTVNTRLHYRDYDGVTPIGADVQMLKYTGQFGNDLTLTASHGRSQSKHELSSPDFDVYDALSGVSPVSAPARVVPPGLTIRNGSPFLTTDTIAPKGARDEVTASRVDLEYRLGAHSLRAGLDRNKIQAEKNGRVRPGDGIWSYLLSSRPPTEPIAMSVGTPVAPASGGGFGTQGYYVLQSRFVTTTDASSAQDAIYLEDKWQVTRNLQLTAGLRNENFSHRNGDNQEFLSVKNQLQPRFAAAWDVHGDASLKLFGSAGRYAVQTPNQVTERHGSRSSNTRQYFTYTGVNAATGAPTGLTALTGLRSPNNELNQERDPNVLVASDLEPSYQDELTLGFEKAFAKSFNVGARLTHRKLRSVIDDACEIRWFENWAARNNVTVSDHFYSTFSCVIFNPGRGNTFRMDLEGPGIYRDIVLSNADQAGNGGITFPKAKRTYSALDLFAEHPLRNGWYGRVSYTWSRNHGNTEGQTNSDIGQADVGKTQNWDYPEQTLYTEGPLPNDRRHQIKAYGYVELTPQWNLGANLLISSGRPRNCTGDAPTSPVDLDPHGYNPGAFFCDGKPAPRGSRGRLPGERRLDLNVAYKPDFAKGLVARVDVFNVLNRQSTQAIDEIYEDGSGGFSNTYGRTLSYTAPRSVRFSVAYEHKF
ncbi:MAG: TonB-dependent receptor [Burkholderiales bacterium]|nr:TonB-dependent receptor [Burkholderiales bacterium]